MSLLITLASITAYLAAASLTARRAVNRLSQTEPARNQSTGSWHAENTTVSVVCGLLWPLVVLAVVARDFVIRPVSAWLWKPVHEREARVARLEEDLQAWRGKRRDAAGDDDRRMASDVIESLEDILRRSR